MPYKKSKKISRRRNKRGTKHRSKRFRKSKRKTKYHKKGGAGFFDGLKKMVGMDEETILKRKAKNDCIKKNDEIIKQAKEAKKNCGKTEKSMSIPSSSTSSSSSSDIDLMSNQQEDLLQEPTQSTAVPPRAIRAPQPGPQPGPDDDRVGGKNGRKKKSKRKRRTKHH